MQQNDFNQLQQLEQLPLQNAIPRRGIQQQLIPQIEEKAVPLFPQVAPPVPVQEPVPAVPEEQSSLSVPAPEIELGCSLVLMELPEGTIQTPPVELVGYQAVTFPKPEPIIPVDLRELLSLERLVFLPLPLQP